MAAAEEGLREPWEQLPRQREAATFAIWCFLATELLFFGGLFLGYSVYRDLYPEAFKTAARETSIFYGTLNTVILMTSSLTMVLAERGAQARLRRLALWCLAATVLLGSAFLVVKGFEYAEDLKKGLLPGWKFTLTEPYTELFFAFYWMMTAVHAVHLTIGIGLVSGLLVRSTLSELALSESPQVEVTALTGTSSMRSGSCCTRSSTSSAGRRHQGRPNEPTPWQVCRPHVFAWAALCLLLAATFVLAYVPLGSFNPVVSLSIAAVKVLVIAFVFMGLRHDSALVRLASATGFVWLIFLFALTFTDHLSR